MCVPLRGGPQSQRRAPRRTGQKIGLQHSESMQGTHAMHGRHGGASSIVLWTFSDGCLSIVLVKILLLVSKSYV